MKNENIKELIRYEYENEGIGVTALSKKYKTSANTINSWKQRENWEKKVALKRTAPNKKNCTKNKNGARNKEIEIKQDFLNGKTKEEIMQKYAIAERTYYEKTKSVREMQIEQSEKVLQAIVEEKYSDVKDRLIEIIEEKDRLIKELLKNTNLGEKEKHASIKERLNLLKEVEKDIKNNARIISDYRQAELEQQLENEKIL